jgi:hypothetical protein
MESCKSGLPPPVVKPLKVELRPYFRRRKFHRDYDGSWRDCAHSLARLGSTMEVQGAAETRTQIALCFIVAGILAGAASIPVLHFLNDRYRFEPTGLMSTSQALIDNENNARRRGDWLSSALQGGLLGAIFGVFFGAAKGMTKRSFGDALSGALLGGLVGGAAAIPARNAIREFSLYCVSHNLHGLPVSAAVQGLLWAGPILGAAIGLWAATRFQRHGAILGFSTIVAGAIACFLVPAIGEVVFPVDYSDQIAEHFGQSVLTSLLVGGILGVAVAFADRPAPDNSTP